MVCAHITLATQTKFASDIDIAFLIDLSALADAFDTILVALPWRSAVNTLHWTCGELAWCCPPSWRLGLVKDSGGPTRFAPSPLLEAMAMNVISTRTLAPQNLLGLVTLVELHDADWTVSFNWLAGTACICSS